MTQDTNDPGLGFKGGFKGGFRQSMSWLHTWAGLVLALVLYFMFITGSFGYFNAEIDRWMRPEMPAPAAPPPAPETAERAIARLQQRLPDAKAWYITLPVGRYAHEVSIYAEPKPGVDGEEPEGVEERLAPATGQPFTGVRKTGGGSALYSMHYALHYIAYDVAIYIVGLATMFMLVAIATGIVVHKKIFKDFFTFRPAKGQRSWLDAHNVSSVMALPFFVVITYSGLIFYIYEYMPSAKWAAYGFGPQAEEAMDKDRPADAAMAEPEAAGRPAPLVPLAPLMAAAEARWGRGEVAYVNVINPGDANARVRIERNLRNAVSRNSESLLFDGSSGALLQVSPADTGGGAEVLSSVMLALHEGHFAAPLLRWLYFASGLLGAAMIATGLVLWTRKRRQRLKRDEAPDAGLRFVERLNVGTIVGLPIAVAVYFWANRLLPAAWGPRADWEMHALFIAWALAFAHAAMRPLRRAWQEQFAAAAALFALLPLLNAATTSTHLAATLPQRDGVLAGFDLTALATGAVCAALAWRMHLKAVPPLHAAADANQQGAAA